MNSSALLSTPDDDAGGGMDRRVARPWHAKRAYRVGAAGAAVACAVVAAWVLAPKAGTVTVAAETLAVGEVVRAPYIDYAAVRAEAVPALTTLVAAEASGRVERVGASDGDSVTSGQVLAVLSNPQMSLDVATREADISARISDNASRIMALKSAEEAREQALADTAHALNKAQQELDKRQVLLARDLLSPAAIRPFVDEVAYQRGRLAALAAGQASDKVFYAAQRAQAARTSEDLRRNLVQAGAGRSVLTVRAPTAGRLTAFDLKPGQAVTLGQSLGQVDVEDVYKLQAQVDEFYLQRLTVGQSADANVHGRPVRIRVAKIYPQVTAGRVTVDLAFLGAQPADLKRGEAIDLRLSLGRSDVAVVAPPGAWLAETGGAWAFVLSPDSKQAVRRAVTIGRRNPEQVEVLSGLAPGDRFIVAGAQDLLKAKILRLRTRG
jgi:HlyD family secretion protein